MALAGSEERAISPGSVTTTHAPTATNVQWNVPFS